MKSIQLKQYTHVKGIYKVSIGNGIHRDFKNKKSCLKFLVNCNRYLTIKLVEVNSIFVNLFTHYRRNWFYFDHNKNPGFELFEADRRCKKNLESISNVFDIMVERSHYQNGNHFVFAHFKMILRDMKQVITLLQVLMKSKSNTVDFHELHIIYLTITKVEKEIFEFDGTFTQEELDADEIFTRNRMKAV